MKTPPDFTEYINLEAEILKNKLSGIRKTTAHAGEKGRSVEHQIMSLVRDILPNKYGIGTGFIAYHPSECVSKKENDRGPSYSKENDIIKLSDQLDIIIYDALNGGPLVKFDTYEIYPIESTLAYIEVKADLRNIKESSGQWKGKTQIEKFLLQSHKLRKLRTRLYRVNQPNSPTRTYLVARTDCISIRSYLFAVDCHGFKNIEKLIEKIRASNTNADGFISGAYIGDKGYLQHHKSYSKEDPDYMKIEYEIKTPLVFFKKEIYQGIFRYPEYNLIGVPAIETYFCPEEIDGVFEKDKILLFEEGK